MKNILLASTSTIFGGKYLEYLRSEITQLFQSADEILFIPYARPGGVSHDSYTQKAMDFFTTLNKNLTGLHSAKDPITALQNAKAIFTGGGNTFLLVKMLHELGIMDTLRKVVEDGTPYLGCSAGSNIGGPSMKTTNDMPIVYPPSFQTLGWVPFNINPHFISGSAIAGHMGETRETRIEEFLQFNSVPVIGLKEGSWIRVHGNKILLEGSGEAVLFEKDKTAVNLPTGSDLDFKNQGI